MRHLLALLVLLTTVNAQAYNGFTMPTRTSTSQPTCTAALENNVWTIGSTANVPTLSQVCTCASSGTSCAWVTPGTQIVALNQTIASGNANVSITTNDTPGASVGGSLNFRGKWYSVTPLWTDFASISGRKETAGDGTSDAGFLALSTRPLSGSQTERLRITSTGKVGIGTSAPDETLSVSGAVLIKNGVAGLAGRGLNVYYDQSGTTAYLVPYNPGVAYEAMQLDVSHLNVVTHNPASPKTMLVVDDGVTTFGTGTNSNNVYAYGMITARPPSTDTIQGDTRWSFGNGSSNAVDGIGNIQTISNPIGSYLPMRMDASTWSVRTDPTTVTGKSHLFVDGNGLFGVGTDIPVGKLQVNTAEVQGTGTISTSTTTVTGSSTAFDTQLAVGDTIKIVRGFIVEYRTVASITNATSMTINAAFSTNVVAGQAFFFSIPELSVDGTSGATTFGSTVELDSTSTTHPTCSADGDVGRFSRYTKSAGATISICLCTKLSSVYTLTALGTGDCT